ncbi:MAG TPA: proline--tRNA ligase [Pirellulales bacterium]|jgi:prolyl-tRNA synthetase|nr:proline--tRNA ligase [Pirellulales bacterium]
MAKAPKTAITPTREADYPEWYQQVVKAADLAEISPVRGCMVIKPWGYAIWENIQRTLDRMFKETGHQNAYFPLFIPLSYLEKEAQHVEGFAKECAVVTHHRLEAGPGGGLVPTGKLEEPLVIRPTSETIIGAMYAKWVQSYRDLPILINQWANVVRWEMRTRLFLRTTEFLWQEGHTAHATEAEAMEETLKILDLYATFAQDYMAMPVIKGEKTAGERFPGAVNTYSIEAMMQDRKALQAGTSHFLGQNFSKAQEIKFLNQEGKETFAWTTSWGVSTRLVGALIMTHSDDDGLVLPPRLAPEHVVILPIFRTDEEQSAVLDYCRRVQQELAAKTYDGERIRVIFDTRDLRGGEKTWQHIKKGVPLRLEIGPRDVAGDSLFVGRRDTQEKKSVPRGEFIATVDQRLGEIQTALFQRALAERETNTREFNDRDEFIRYFTPKNEGQPEIHGGFALAHVAEDSAVDQLLKDLKVTIRCVSQPGEIGSDGGDGRCIFTGKPGRRVVLAKAY